MAPRISLPRDVADRPGVTSANDALIDLYMERAIDLLRLEAGTRDKVIGQLDQLETDLVALIAKIDPSNGRQQVRLASLLKQVRDSIKATYRTNDTLLAREMREVADVEATWTGNAINSAIQVDFVDVGLSRQYLSTLVSDVLIQGASSKEWWGRQAEGLAQRFTDEMRRGLALGETNGDLVRRVRGTRTTKGFMDLARTSAERLVRASVQATANAAREATYAENTDLITAVQWHATLDTRTSIWCLTRDRHLYDPTTHAPKDGAPPWLEGPGRLHWGCRSTSVPILKSWRDLGIDENEVPETTRASMDGQVPADQSFETWLGKQTQARQDTVLGSGKAQLWRDGKISFRDLLDQSGRPLTTEQLRAKAAKR